MSISDVTPLAREIHALVRSGYLDAAARLLPDGRPCPAGKELLGHLGGDGEGDGQGDGA